MNFSVLGASVSAQTVKHDTGEVSGYVEVFNRHLASAVGLGPVTQVCYPGNRASDGGLVRAVDVAARGPGICLFEPLVEDFARGVAVSARDLRFVYGRLLHANVLPVTLFLPDPKVADCRRWEAFPLYQRLCTQLGLPTITVSIPPETDMAAGFVGVHTLSPGAALYAEQVRSGLAGMADRLARFDFAAAKSKVGSGWYCRKIGAGQGDLQSYGFRVRKESDAPTQFKIVQLQDIGVFSPLVDVAVEGAQGFQYSVSFWDPYCHYTRRSYMTLATGTLVASGDYHVRGKVSRVRPNYGESRRKMESLPSAESLVLRPRGPFYVFSSAPLAMELVA